MKEQWADQRKELQEQRHDKNFTEQLILGEIVAQTIERDTGLAVDRRLNLGGTLIAERALANADIDVYVEYTGTALMDIFTSPNQTDRALVLASVKADYEKVGLTALAPLGYENNFALVVRNDDAVRFGLARISDLQDVQSRFRLGMFGEFLERADGLPGLLKVYELMFTQAPVEMDLGLLYRALEGHQIDLAVGSTTDGLIAAKGFVVLEDDRHYFPPYDALPVVRNTAFARHPGLKDAVNALAGRIDAATIRRLNFEVDGRHRDPKDVARDFIATLGIVKPSP